MVFEQGRHNRCDLRCIFSLFDGFIVTLLVVSRLVVSRLVVSRLVVSRLVVT
jgi:hypothetical protein